MTPWLRTLRAAGVLLVLATGAAQPSYGAPHDPEPTPTADASRAGSRPGEGRERPGRKESAPQDQNGQDGYDEDGYGEDTQPAYTDPDPAVSDGPAATVAPEPSRDAAVPVQQNVVGPGPAPEPVLQILPLGSGLILIGLGLGLAFLALRVRRR